VPPEGNGTFIIASLPPGEYVLEVEAQGFKKSVTTGVKTLVDTVSADQPDP
jgi:hypothetical protein